MEFEQTVEPGFPPLDGRFLVEVTWWDATLHVGLASPRTPRKFRFQAGLSYVSGFVLKGRVVAPRPSSGKAIRVHLMPFGPKLKTEGLKKVGQLSSGSGYLSTQLLLPEAALPLAATCLGTVWKFLHFWTFDEREDGASISEFTFSTDIHPNLSAWVDGDA